MRVATWNVNSLKARLPRVEEWLGYADVDVLCLQETKLSDAGFPSLAFETLGYASCHHGHGQWNGVAIVSRVGLEDVAAGFAGPEPAGSAVAGSPTAPDDTRSDDERAYDLSVQAEARIVSATCGGVRVTSVYVPNGRSPEDPHYRAKLRWLERLRGHVEQTAARTDRYIVTGDFNIAPDDRDVWDIRAFAGSTHVTAPERAALAALCAAGLDDTFRRLYDGDGLYTYWDYRAGDFHQHRGMRIDLLLASPALTARASWGVVDRNARKGKQPSDHAPLVIDFAQ